MVKIKQYLMRDNEGALYIAPNRDNALARALLGHEIIARLQPAQLSRTLSHGYCVAKGGEVQSIVNGACAAISQAEKTGGKWYNLTASNLPDGFMDQCEALGLVSNPSIAVDVF